MIRLPVRSVLAALALMLVVGGDLLAQGGPSLLDVASYRTPPGTAVAVLAPELVASFDLKLTIRVPRLFGGPIVSSGSGLKSAFAVVGTAGSPRRATLARSLIAPYGIVRYNDGGPRFHVRHLLAGEPEVALRESGLRVIDAWKAHYRTYGLTAAEMGGEWGPVVIRNAYEQPGGMAPRASPLTPLASLAPARSRGADSPESTPA